MNETPAKRRLLILEALKFRTTPVSSATLSAELGMRGADFSERTIRLDLAAMDKDGVTENFGRRGHLITDRGRDELNSAHTVQRIGFLSSKIDAMIYGMDFDLEHHKGTVVVNMTICTADQLAPAIEEISAVFARGFAMGTLVALIPPGEKVGEMTVPKGKLGFCTVCSITLNGILLQHGVPMRSRFGGLLEIRSGRPVRFAEAINYNGTSLDPLVIFIRGGFTNYRSAIHNGNGLIGASFREIPAASHDFAREIAKKSVQSGIGGFLEISSPMGGEFYGIPVNEGCCGAVVIGGLNPVSILVERGNPVLASALSGFLDFKRLFPYTQLPSHFASLRIKHGL